MAKNSVFDSNVGNPFIEMDDEVQYFFRRIGYSAKSGTWFINTGDTDDNGEEIVHEVSELRGVIPLAVRKRIVITDDTGVEHYYPDRTPKVKQVAGAFSRRIQIVCTLDYESTVGEPLLLEENDTPLFMIGLRGYVKTVSWLNPRGGPYANSDFAPGIEPMLKLTARQYCEDNKLKKNAVPWCGAVQFDIVPYKALTVGTGREKSKVQLFTGNNYEVQPEGYEMRVAWFVENDLKEWVNEWAVAGLGSEPELDVFEEDTDADGDDRPEPFF